MGVMYKIHCKEKTHLFVWFTDYTEETYSPYRVWRNAYDVPFIAEGI